MRETSRLAKRSGLFAGLAVATSVAFQMLMIAAILLRPEIDPARNPISEYAIGRLGWLAVLGFLASARCLRLPCGRPAAQAAGPTRPDRAVHAVLLRVGHGCGRPVRGGPSHDADE